VESQEWATGTGWWGTRGRGGVEWLAVTRSDRCSASSVMPSAVPLNRFQRTRVHQRWCFDRTMFFVVRCVPSEDGVPGGCAMRCSAGWWGVDGAHGVDANRNWPKSGRRMPANSVRPRKWPALHVHCLDQPPFRFATASSQSQLLQRGGWQGVGAWLRAEKRRLHEPVLSTHWPTHLSHR
jgi:hypothetical protein